MLVPSIAAVVGGVVLLYVIAIVVRSLGGGRNLTLLSQIIIHGASAWLLVSNSIILVPAAVVLALLPFVIRVFAMMWFYYIGKKILNGDFGEESQWAAQLTEAGDEEFIEASQNLSKIELRESGIIAETREEMRDVVIEKSNNQKNE